MSSILLTPDEVKELERMCNDPFLELGMTLRPKHLRCFKPHIVTTGMRVIVLFEKHENAEKWNKMHETRIRKGGHLATITLSALVASLTKSFPGTIASGSGTAILKDEVQARIWYPKMFKDWLLTRHFIFSYEQFPHQNFYMQWTDVIQDETGKEVEKRRHGQSHCKVSGFFGIPEKLVRDLMNCYPLHTVRFK